jgi:molybdate transport system substrate-binding protein
VTPAAVRPLALALTAAVSLAAPAPGADEPLSISVAMSLRPVMQEIVALYEGDRPTGKPRINAAASGVLLQQALRGAPVDLLISASPLELDRLEEAGRLDPAERRVVASNRLVLVLATETPTLEAPTELTGDAFRRIAVGNPRTAPLGRYTRQAFESLGLWRRLESRFVLGESARHVLEYAARGEADAAVVYGSDVILARGRVRVAFELPACAHEAIRYEAAILARGERRESARRLLDLLVSDRGRRVLSDHGFSPPP